MLIVDLYKVIFVTVKWLPLNYKKLFTTSTQLSQLRSYSSSSLKHSPSLWRESAHSCGWKGRGNREWPHPPQKSSRDLIGLARIAQDQDHSMTMITILCLFCHNIVTLQTNFDPDKYSTSTVHHALWDLYNQVILNFSEDGVQRGY